MHTGTHFAVKTHIFLTGATGYIGGSVLERLLSHSLSETFRITILVRDESKALQFRSMGIHVMIGSYSDLSLLEDLAADSDFIFACADADDLDAAKAILQGLKKRYEKTSKAPSLIHTSGTGVLADDAQGMFATDTIYSDLNVDQIRTLPMTRLHRPVDVALVEADKEGYVETYIVLPSTIYGIASGLLVDAGLQNSHSQQIPALVQLSLARGRAGMIGQGKNVWPNVHINEVTDLYILIFDQILPHDVNTDHSSKSQGPNAHFEHGESGFYFGENGEHSLYEVSETIGKIMVALEKSEESTPTPFSEEEVRKHFPKGTTLGGNSRCKADRSRAIGWKPKKTTKDMLASIKHEFKH